MTTFHVFNTSVLYDGLKISLYGESLQQKSIQPVMSEPDRSLQGPIRPFGILCTLMKYFEPSQSHA